MEALSDLSLPPGFGFHPTDVELISHYLKRKVHGQKIDYDVIPEIDIYKHEPWDLSSKCNVPTRDTKWHFFTAKDRKYPNGSRSNRATEAGYWKSTGKDRNIKIKNKIIGTKKTLVFHEGRPPAGKRTEWIMHEYYLDENECKSASDLKDLFVLCRVTKRDGFSSEVDMRAPPEVVPNETEQPDGAANPVVCDNLSSLSENIVSRENTNNNNNQQQDDIDKWLLELFDPNFGAVSLVDESPVGPTPAALKPEPTYYSPGEGSEDENRYLLQEDIQSILGNYNPESTHDLQFLEDETTGGIISSADYSNFVNYSNEDDDDENAGIVIKQSSITRYDNPNDNDNKYNHLKRTKLQVHLYKKEEKSLETANKTLNFVPKDGFVGEFENCEKVEGEDGNLRKSTAPNGAKRRGSTFGISTFILSALVVGGIAILFYFVSNNSVVVS